MVKISDLNMRVDEQTLQLQTFLLLIGLKDFLHLNRNKDILKCCERPLDWLRFSKELCLSDV